MCFTYSECKSFRFESIPQMSDCDPAEEADCRGGRCKLLTDEVVNDHGLLDDSGKYIYGEKEICTESVSQAAKEYFFDEKTRYHAARENFISARNLYDDQNENSIHLYSYYATNCVGPLITKGIISEEEMGVAQSVKDGKLPYQPAEDLHPITKTVTFNVKDFGGGKYWMFTGLWALAGKFVTVSSPDTVLEQAKIVIGANKDKLYHKDYYHRRDSQVTSNFLLTDSQQTIGSVYGGLIILELKGQTDLIGKMFDITFGNVIEAPIFNLDTDTNDDWNQMKFKPAPWSVFRVPNKIIFVLPTVHVRKLTDVTTNLQEWADFMDKSDHAACKTDRSKAEIIVPDVAVANGIAHSGYPIGSMHRPTLNGNVTFPQRGTINTPYMALGI